MFILALVVGIPVGIMALLLLGKLIVLNSRSVLFSLVFTDYVNDKYLILGGEQRKNNLKKLQEFKETQDNQSIGLIWSLLYSTRSFKLARKIFKNMVKFEFNFNL